MVTLSRKPEASVMVQIQRNTSSWRSSDDLADMDFTQAAELLGSSLDLADEMSLIGMDNLFDDVDSVITDDRDIFMGCTDDSHDTQFKNDIFESGDSTDQGVLCYNELSPETVPYDEVTSPLHSSSDESQDTASYSGGLTPESDIMDSDIMDEEPICNEGIIPLVALELTGEISPLKDTKKPTRRKTTATKAGGIRKRRLPAKNKPTKTVRGRVSRNKRVEPDVQCMKVCPPVIEKSSSTFSPSTLFPTIMSALRTNPPIAVPLEKLIKPKHLEAANPDISCIQTPPTTPVELKPSVVLGAPLEDIHNNEAFQNSQIKDIEVDIGLKEGDIVKPQMKSATKTVEVVNTPEISVASEEGIKTRELEMKDNKIEVKVEVNDIEAFEAMEFVNGTDENQNETKMDIEDQQTEQSARNSFMKSRGKLVKIPSPTRMTTRGITRRRPSIPIKTTRNEVRSPKASHISPTNKESLTVDKPLELTELPQQKAAVSVQPVCTSGSMITQCKTPFPTQVLTLPTVQNKPVTISQISTLCSKTLPLVNKSASVTIVSSTARLGQPTVTSQPRTKVEHQLPLPAKITAVPLTAIPARSTILGILPSTTRIRPLAATQSAPIMLHSVMAPTKLLTTQAASLPGASVKLKPQPIASFPSLPQLPSSLVAPVLSNTPQLSSTVLSMVGKTVVRPASLVQANVPVCPAPADYSPPVCIKQEVDSDSDDYEESDDANDSVASRNTEILHLLNKQTDMSCVKIEEDTLPRSYSGYSSSSSCSPAPTLSPPYEMAPTPAVVSIKEEMLSDFSDCEDDYERFKNLPPEEQARVRRRRYNNRVAAQRCRQRKRDHFQGLKKEIQGWECSNTQLRYEIHVLQKELKNLSKVWNEHTTKCETAKVMQKRKKKHKKLQRSQSAASSPACNQGTASSPINCDPSPTPVPIVVN